MPKAKMLDMTTKVNINAEDLFTDREEPRKAFWDIYNSMEDGDYEVIAYYGVGGIGKTTLLKQIGKEIDEKIKDGNKDHLFVSFEGKPEKEQVLYMISRQLMLCNKGLSCPLFDEAFCRLLELAGKSSEPYEKQMRDLISDNQVFSTIVGLANDISPIPGVIGATASVVDGIVSLARNRLKEKDMTQGKNAYIYNEIKYSDIKELRKNIHLYLRQDIQECMAEREKPFVFLVDGYENFVDIRETGKEVIHLEKDEWLKNFDTGFSPIPNTIWVIAGREMPHWDKEVLTPDHMHRIGNLSETDAEDFFVKAGIIDYELRSSLYVLTKGTPAYMDMCVSAYRKMAKEKIPKISDFGKNTSELASRFLENMSKDMKQMIYILTGLPDVFSRELAKSVAKRLEKRECIAALDEILIMSLVESVDQGYKLHSTLKDVIRKEHRNDAESDELSIVMESSIAATQIIAERIINSNEPNYLIADLRNYTELLGGVSYDGVEDDIEKIIGIISNEMDTTGNYTLGVELMNPCIEYLDKNSDNDELKIAAQNIRNINLRKLGKYKEYYQYAKETYYYAVACLGDEHPKTLVSLSNLANSYENAGDIQTALELRKKCYGLMVEVLGEEHPDTLSNLNNLAISYKNVGNSQTALELQKKCYELTTKVLGEEHSDTLSCLNNLANSYADAGDIETALRLQVKSYELRVKILGEEHPNTLSSLNNLAVSYGDAGDVESALVLAKKCYELRTKVLGEEHPDTLRSLNNLAIRYLGVKDAKISLEMAKKCYILREKLLGEKHPDTLKTMQLVKIIEDLCN